MAAGLLPLGDVGGHHVLGFIEEDVDTRPAAIRFELDWLAIDFDLVHLGIDEDGEIGDDAAVEGDAALADHFFDIAPRIDAGVGEEFLDSLFQFSFGDADKKRNPGTSIPGLWKALSEING